MASVPTADVYKMPMALTRAHEAISVPAKTWPWAAWPSPCYSSENSAPYKSDCFDT